LNERCSKSRCLPEAICIPINEQEENERATEGLPGLGELYPLALAKRLAACFFPFDFLSTQTLLLTVYTMFSKKNCFRSVNIRFVFDTIGLLPLGRSGSSAA
jgi:hypothetical protein